MDYELGFDNYSGIFALPTEAADKYINEATLSDLKVLVYVFRNSGTPLNEATACEFLGLTPEQLLSSLKFWADRKIISLKAAYKAENIPTAIKEQNKTEAQTAARRVLDMPVQYGQEEIARKSQGNSEIKFLLEAVPEQLGKLISPSECSTLIYLYEDVGLPADVIIMLIGYCVSIGKSKMQYIQKVALGWAEEGIDTHEKAESKICELEANQNFEGKVLAILGIYDGAPAPTVQQFIARWCEWKTPLELVKLAYDIGVTRTGKLSLPYINKILSEWHKKGYTTVEQAHGENKQSKGSGNKTPSYDIDEYVRLSINRLNKE